MTGLFAIIYGSSLVNQFSKRQPDGSIKRGSLLEIVEGSVPGEHWLFVTPHDDDVAVAGGLLVMAAVDAGIRISVRVVTDGRLGYTRVEDREDIVRIRREETLESFALLGVTDVEWYGYPDGNLYPHAMGRIDPTLWHNRHNDPQSIEAEFRGDKGRGWLMRWLPARAHDNGMFLLFSNGVGLDDDEVRTGNAMVIDCYGRIINETFRAEDELVAANLDLDLLPMCTGRRWLRGRRPELYGPLAEAYGYEVDPRAARFSSNPATEARRRMN